MKTLLLLRHAKSSWDDANLLDHDRPLNKRGQRDAPRMGEVLREENLLPDLVLSSDALRASQTIELVMEASDYQSEIRFSRDLYAAGPLACLEALAGIEDDYSCVMLVGHNPGLEELLALLCGQNESLPTAALAQLRLPIEQWSDLKNKTRGELVEIWRPKEI